MVQHSAMGVELLAAAQNNRVVSAARIRELNSVSRFEGPGLGAGRIGIGIGVIRQKIAHDGRAYRWPAASSVTRRSMFTAARTRAGSPAELSSTITRPGTSCGKLLIWVIQ